MVACGIACSSRQQCGAGAESQKPVTVCHGFDRCCTSVRRVVLVRGAAARAISASPLCSFDVRTVIALQATTAAVRLCSACRAARVAAMQIVTRRPAALVPTIARTRRHLATQQQGDWTAVAARDYASHRQTFQADYARDCWRRLSSRPAVAPVVARAARVLDVGCGSGEFTAELAGQLPHASIVGARHLGRHGAARGTGERPRARNAPWPIANDDRSRGPLALPGRDVDDGAALAGPRSASFWPCLLSLSPMALYFSRAFTVLGRVQRASTPSKKSRAWTSRPPHHVQAPLRGRVGRSRVRCGLRRCLR